MNELKVFNNSEFGDVRVIEIDNEPWFVGKDVAEILGYAETANMRKLLDETEYIEIDPQSRLFTGFVQNGMSLEPNKNVRRMLLVNESGLYQAIFGSTLEGAKKFKKWVTSEVLPSIRKHGAYMTDSTLEEALANPDFGIKLLTKLKEEKEARKKLEAKVEEDRPKVLFADAVSASDTSILIGDLAKILKQNGYDTGQKRLFEILRDEGFLMKSGTSKNMPTQKAMEIGLFEVKETTINNPDGSTRISKTTKCTGKGQQYFINYFLTRKAAHNIAYFQTAKA